MTRNATATETPTLTLPELANQIAEAHSTLLTAATPHGLASDLKSAAWDYQLRTKDLADEIERVTRLATRAQDRFASDPRANQGGLSELLQACGPASNLLRAQERMAESETRLRTLWATARQLGLVAVVRVSAA